MELLSFINPTYVKGKKIAMIFIINYLKYIILIHIKLIN